MPRLPPAARRARPPHDSCETDAPSPDRVGLARIPGWSTRSPPDCWQPDALGMRNPFPFPVPLLGRAIRTADAGHWGVTERRMWARDVSHPHHGVFGVGLRVTSMLERCLAYEPRLLDGQLFSHTTALALWGAPVPRSQKEPLHLAVWFPRTPPRTVGAIGHSLQRLDATSRFGFPVSMPASAWCESAGLLNRVELVAAGDSLVTGARAAGKRAAPHCSLRELRDALAARPGSPGAGRALWALERIRVGVDSFTETHCAFS